MDISKPSANDLSHSKIICSFKNLNNIPIENLIFQAAVPKYLKLELSPPTNTTILPSYSNIPTNTVTQEIKLINSMQGQKNIMLKLKIGYKLGSTIVSYIHL